MIRFLRALAWLRWRLLVNGLKGGRRRDAMERFSRLAGLLARGFLLLLFLGSAAVVGLLGLLGGWLAGSGRVEPAPILLAGRFLLLAVLALLVLVPLGRSTPGAAGGYARFLLLPIPRRHLHRVEVLASLADPWVAFVLPGIFLFPAGLLLAGRGGPAVVALVVAVGFAAVLASLGSLVSFLLDWLMRNRRRGEIFTLAFVLGLSLIGVLPAFFGEDLEIRLRAGKEAGSREGASRIERLDAALPRWSRAIPSEIYGRSIARGLGESAGAWWPGVGVLGLEAAALFGLSAVVHGRLLGAAEGGGRRRRAARLGKAAPRLPGLNPAATAVAFAQARTGLRSVRGRVVVLLPGPLLALMGLLFRRIPGEFPGGAFLGAHGEALFGAGVVFCLYAMQAFTMNQFASDRDGLALQFLAPIREEDLVRGKAVGCGLILGAAVLLCLVCALIASPGGSPLAWMAVLLGGVATYLLQSPAAALLSTIFPVTADLSRTGSGGNPHGVAMLTGTFLVLGLAGPPGTILALAYHVFHRPGLALLLVAVWTVLCACVSIPLLGLAARALTQRRENLLLVSRGR